MIKVIVIEGQQLMREGIRALLSNADDIEVIYLAGSKEEIDTLFTKECVDIVLLDVDIENVNPIELMRTLKKQYPNLKVIMMTNELNEKHIFDGISAGADAFVQKNLDIQNFIRMIHDVHKGQQLFSGDVARLVASRIRSFSYSEEDFLEYKLRTKDIYLSKRERDVAYLMMKSYNNQQIADKLKLTEGTVKNYISTIYAKLDMNKRRDVQDFLLNLTED